MASWDKDTSMLAGLCQTLKNFKEYFSLFFSLNETSLNDVFVCFFFLKITELLNDVERLKQALNGLSQLTYTTGTPSKRQNQQVEMLQNQVKTLQQQLAVSNCARWWLKQCHCPVSCINKGICMWSREQWG